MSLWLKATIILSTFFFMEFVAWFTHKYIMHGFMWSWHKSHHKVHQHPLEKNDLFALVFSIPSILLIVLGYELPDYEFLRYLGFGVMAYGIFYFIFHDIIVHRRIKIPFKTNSRYMQRIMRAHYIHHSFHEKDEAEAFGFLYAPKKYDKDQKSKD